jgi:glycosyltransferase involved in cell wall biosynthesis
VTVSRPLLIVGAGIVGGVEEHVLSLLSAFKRLGVAAIVAAPFPGEFTQALLDCGHPSEDIAIVEMSDQLDVHALASVVWLCRARRVTIVHAHMRGADVMAAPAAALAGIPALSTLHGVVRSAHEVVLNRLYGLRYVAVSEAGRLSAVRAGIRPCDVHVVRNGVDGERFDPGRVDRRSSRRMLELADGLVAVTTIARLMPEKDPLAVLEVARRLETSHPQAHFIVVGTGALEAQLRDAARSHRNVTVLGTRRDIPAILAASDLLLLPSRSEALPLVAMEAMAMQLPVVAYDVGGVNELVTASTGRLVPAGDVAALTAAVAGLVDAEWVRRGLGRAARARVLESFTHARCGDEVLERYQALERSNADTMRAPAQRVEGSWAQG